MKLDASAVLSGDARWCLVHADNRDVLPTLRDKAVDHVITDPPYTQRTSDGAVTGAPSTGTRKLVTFAGVDGQESEIADACLRIAARWVLIWCAFEQLGAYAAAAGKAWIRSGVWHKPDATPQFTGDRPAMCGEACAIMHRTGRKRWNGGGYPAFWSYHYERERNGHPTPKPLPLMLELVELFTDPEEVVLDPFAGSGTTGIACLRLGRRFIGIEKDAGYAQIATDRLRAESQGLTLRAARAGQLPLFAGSGHE